MPKNGLKILLMYPPSNEHFQALKSAAPDAEWGVAESEEFAKQWIQDARVVLGNRYFLQSLPYAHSLQWMQSNSAGTDIVLNGTKDRSEIIITSSKGVYNHEMADHALALVLAMVRDIPQTCEDQNLNVWNRRNLHSLANQKIMILGFGNVGKAIAARLKAFGCEIFGVRLNHFGSMEVLDERIQLCGPAQWRELLPGMNMLIMALPITQYTRNIVSLNELSALKKGAYVVNIGRGETLNESALKEALDQGYVKGAALDVFAKEPLPPDHWMWKDRRILITPHVGRSVEMPPYKWEPLFVENVYRFYNELPLLNQVNRSVGY